MEDKLKKCLENKKAQMRKGVLEFCILLAISKKRMYASEIIMKLKKADLIVVEGTLYPLLTRLKNTGFLEYSWEESKSGPPRKYYELTKEGRVMLKETTTVWEDVNKSIKTLI